MELIFFGVAPPLLHGIVLSFGKPVFKHNRCLCCTNYVKNEEIFAPSTISPSLETHLHLISIKSSNGRNDIRNIAFKLFYIKKFWVNFDPQFRLKWHYQYCISSFYTKKKKFWVQQKSVLCCSWRTRCRRKNHKDFDFSTRK